MEVAEKIKAAREYGDLSENSEYDEAKNEQALLDSKIEEVEALVRNAKVIDNISTKTISVGVSVKLFDYEFDEDGEPSSRKEAHNLNAIFQVGKEGVTQNQAKGISDALEAKELLKVKLLESCPDDVKTVALELSVLTKSEVVQIIGRTIVLYRQSDKKLYRI